MSLRVLVAGAVLGQPLGGVRRHNQALLPRVHALLAAEGGGVGVLVGRTPPAFALDPALELLPSDVPAGPPLMRALHESRALRVALAAARARGRPFDLVHTAHLPTPSGLSVPFTWTVHDLRALEARGLRRLAARPALARACRDAALVVCVSAPVCAELARRFAPRATALVPNGVDHLPLLPREEQAEPFLLHAGHLEPRKDLATLVQALALDAGLPPLVLVGAPKRAEDAHLLELARALGVAARVQLRGVVDDAELARLYARAAAVVIPSRLEGFGLPALEALRAGAPLALSDAAARPLALAARVPSFPTGDAAACARAVRSALEGPRIDAAHAARLVAAHTWDAAASALVRAWHAAASGSL